MMLEPDTIGDPKVLADLLRHFGVELTKMPPLPVGPQELVAFLKKEGVAPDAVTAIIRHFHRNVEIFRPIARERSTAHMLPDRTLIPNSSLAQEMFWSKRTPLITRRSKIVSLGSSFAEDMAGWLQLNGYNYLVKEPDLVEGQTVHASSARWGAIYNAIAFAQIVNWAFGSDERPHVVFRKKRIFDVFREGVFYTEDELPQLERLLQEHTACARAALQEADVVVLILDMNEVYRYLPTGHYLHRVPRINPAVWEPQVLSVEDNVNVLTAAVEELRKFSPHLQFIVGVSPSPLELTSRPDVHVGAASGHSKAVLRVALQQLCASVSGVHYLAALETVMYPGHDLAAWMADERQISAASFAKVMGLFQQQFCDIDDGLRAARTLVPAAVSAANPYFETDHRIIAQATAECVARGFVNATRALDMINHATPALYKNESYGWAYALLRPLSIKSRYTFNLMCREMYRAAFPTSFARTAQSDAISKALREQGYYVIAATPQTRRFAAEMLEAMPAMPAQREVDKKDGLFADLLSEDVDRAFRYFMHEDALPVAPAVKLLDDLGVLRAIGDELGHPILRSVHAWYSVRPSRVAQGDIEGTTYKYHADNDNPTGWIKVFIYLNDVSEENGPHVFVPRSHGERPAELARDGRLSDDEVERHYGPGVKLPGPAGTIIVENTQGLHKAAEVRSGIRAMFQLECVNCLFGSIMERHTRADKVLADLAQYDARFLLRYSLDSQRQ
jgi:hypothetical protein